MRRLSAHHQRREERRATIPDTAPLPEHLRRRHERRQVALNDAPFFQQPRWTEQRHNGEDDGIYTGDAVLKVSIGNRILNIRPQYDTESGIFGTELDVSGHRVELHLDPEGEVVGLQFVGSIEVHAVSSMSVVTEQEFENEQRKLADAHALADGDAVSDVA